MASSDGEYKTRIRPVVIARKADARAPLAYPFLFEAAAGGLSITTMQGEVRLKLREGDFVPERRQPLVQEPPPS
jgi:hypothetical protein